MGAGQAPLFVGFVQAEPPRSATAATGGEVCYFAAFRYRAIAFG